MHSPSRGPQRCSCSWALERNWKLYNHVIRKKYTVTTISYVAIKLWTILKCRIVLILFRTQVSTDMLVYSDWSFAMGAGRRWFVICFKTLSDMAALNANTQCIQIRSETCLRSWRFRAFFCGRQWFVPCVNVQRRLEVARLTRQGQPWDLRMKKMDVYNYDYIIGPAKTIAVQPLGARIFPRWTWSQRSSCIWLLNHFGYLWIVDCSGLPMQALLG